MEANLSTSDVIAKAASGKNDKNDINILEREVSISIIYYNLSSTKYPKLAYRICAWNCKSDLLHT